MGLSTIRRLASTALCGLVLSLGVSPALAFCRTSTCADCPRDEETGCTMGGTPIAWPQACVSFSLNEAAATGIDLETATLLAEDAFNTWQTVRCPPDGEPPSIHIANSFGPVMCREAEYSSNAGNANLIVFREDSWPYGGNANQLGTTTITVTDSGDIVDADMEINATLPLFVGPRAKGFIPGAHDLLSIMTHEAGHFLGLDHSRDEGAIMNLSLASAEVRTELGEDDVAAICAAYPPERKAGKCDDTPHGGFASECAPSSNKVRGVVSCRVHPEGASHGDLSRAALVLGWLAMTVRRRRRSHER